MTVPGRVWRSACLIAPALLVLAACSGSVGDLVDGQPVTTPPSENAKNETAPPPPPPATESEKTTDDGGKKTEDAGVTDSGADSSDAHVEAGKDTGNDASTDSGSGDASTDAGNDAMTCVDPVDALGTEATATMLAPIDDCDNGVFQRTLGVAAGISDVDYYKFSGSDVFGCVVDPAVTATDSNLEICQFVSCNSGAATFVGCNGGTIAQSPSGLPGCCVNTPGTAAPLFDCPGSSDSSTVYMRVRNLVDACTPFTLGYHF